MQTNEICMQVIRTIRNYLHDPDCLSPHRKEKCFVRKRSLSMLQVIQLYLPEREQLEAEFRRFMDGADAKRDDNSKSSDTV